MKAKLYNLVMVNLMFKKDLSYFIAGSWSKIFLESFLMTELFSTTSTKKIPGYLVTAEAEHVLKSKDLHPWSYLSYITAPAVAKVGNGEFVLFCFLWMFFRKLIGMGECIWGWD